ncbi:MAG: O-antigen ligase family protein [Candidatus Omnitrophota bacterium]
MKEKELSFADHLIAAIVLIPVLFPAWVRSGMIREYLSPYWYLSISCFFIFMFSRYLNRESRIRSPVMEILRDPFFYLALMFITQLTIQSWNAGKVRIVDSVTQRVGFSPPHIAWLPGAVDSLLSWDMVVWFLPPLLTVLILRHSPVPGSVYRIIYWGMLTNASLLAILGILVPLLAQPYPSWLAPIFPNPKAFCFSTFPYPNHAGSFFMLHLGLALGLFLYYYRERNEKASSTPLWKIRALTAIISLVFVAIHLCRCRFAILFSWGMVLVFFGYWVYRFRSKVYKIVPVVIIVIVCFSGIGMISDNGGWAKLSEMTHPRSFLKSQWELKWWQTVAAAKMWTDYPVFGIGGGSYRFYLLLYVTRTSERKMAMFNRGMANVHNDFMQFLCEFGIIGAGLLMTMVLLLVLKIIRDQPWKEGFILFGLLGVGGVWVHSWIDLPFRSPPVIIAVAVILAGYGGARRYGSNEKDVKIRMGVVGALFLFISILSWWGTASLRRELSMATVRSVSEKFESGKLSFPDISRMLRSLEWAKWLDDDYKEVHLVSAKMHYTLYRNSRSMNDLKRAFRSVLKARRFISVSDVDFGFLQIEILDAMGYYLEESWCLKCLHERCLRGSHAYLLTEEIYKRRPYLLRE